MELQQLRYIVALAQELSFLKAAKRVHISQPTLSQQVKKLEKELGASLFERSSHGVKITATGEKFLPHALAALDQLELGKSEIQEETGALSGKLTIAAIPTISPYLLPAVIRQLKKTAPKLSLVLYELTTSSLLAELKEGKLDLGVLALPIRDRGIVTRPLGREDFFLAVSREHPLAARKKVQLSDVYSERLLMLTEGHCFADQALEFCKRLRDDEQVIFQGSSLTSVMKLASTGEGVTLVPRMAVEPKANPDLSFIPFAPPKPHRELGLAWRISSPLSRNHRFFIDTVERILNVRREK